MKKTKQHKKHYFEEQNRVVCCKFIKKLMRDPESNISYSSRFAEFVLDDIVDGYRSRRFQTNGGACSLIMCPFCGKPFPKGLAVEWEKVCRQELGKPDKKDKSWLNASYSKKLPNKFLTDEWWLEKKIQLSYKKPRNNLARLKSELKRTTYQKNYDDLKELIAEYENNKNNLNGVCCVELKEEMFKKFDCKINKDIYCSRFPIIYESEKRKFFLPNIAPFFKFHKFPTKSKRELFIQMFNCPWCGTKLPSSLARQWFEIVTKEFGVKDIFNQAELQKKLPPKFLTEEWWREKQL